MKEINIINEIHNTEHYDFPRKTGFYVCKNSLNKVCLCKWMLGENNKFAFHKLINGKYVAVFNIVKWTLVPEELYMET